MVLATGVWDISPLVSDRSAVFPGDTPFSRKKLIDIHSGGNLDLSTITTTPHVGAHADAPVHYDPKGTGIAERDLRHYLGHCQVLTVSKTADRFVDLGDVPLEKIQSRRILFRTLSFPNPNQWTNEFASLSPKLIGSLAEKGVVLIGIDTPSIDAAEAKRLSTHHEIAKHDLAVLEGLSLDKVTDGFYTLVALPLRLEGCDASPVRAVLLPENWSRNWELGDKWTDF